ncbi:hypothetical protein MGG_10206 [Pyricularia oryzae 70-15]|uniref:Uncharacterized protein n=3 Tax=Pyricularia oryzae TaxID=318829 RepID=Q2KER0_PYRO7|nr:uncharacterized protein MGG_10206 [Pyricularia oryzae 70-15]ELQ33680.1 hypothetical protein OOU_Y34scaffold00904g1 [Pyricularia oryzae Y34]KAI7910600.1 hypothetical protein M9X92_010994 [Pyricularia oryzae]EAQ71569.1 hypothetical protein MGCH7_ch7g976 [Pyricularia oryzae 70-15]KAI7911004.1 hypothetical protein M0657_011150 [Pyricularia oryzae]KYQ30497.1 hypothetical protein MGG_10206 [Pyricularia oryzae 70-15]
MPRLFLQLTLLINLLFSTALMANAMAQPAPTPPPQVVAAAVAARQITLSPPDISVDIPTSIPTIRAPGGNTTLSITPSSTSEPEGAAAGLREGSWGAAVYGALVAVVLVVGR